MNKSKKRRNKRYTGEDAKIDQPVVRRYSAVNRSPLGQWWHERKTLLKRVALFGGGGALVIYLLIEAIRSLF